MQRNRVPSLSSSPREESLEKAQQQLGSYEQQIEGLRHQLSQRDQDHEQSLLRLRAQPMAGDTRANLQENIDMIRLQRDLRDKSDELRRLQTQCTNFESVSCTRSESRLPRLCFSSYAAKPFAASHQRRAVERSRSAHAAGQRRAAARNSATQRAAKRLTVEHDAPRGTPADASSRSR